MPTGPGGRRRACARSGGIVIADRDANIAALDRPGQAHHRPRVREAAAPRRRRARLDSGAAADVHVSTTYDRSDLATRVDRPLLRALGEEVGVVVLVILLFLLHARSALIPLVTLPVVLLLDVRGDVGCWACRRRS